MVKGQWNRGFDLLSRLGLSRGTFIRLPAFLPQNDPMMKFGASREKLKPNYIHFSVANLGESGVSVIRFRAHSNHLL